MSAVAEILQSSEETQSSSLLKHAPVGFSLCQRPGNVTSRNSFFDELLGLPSSQIPCALPELIRDGAIAAGGAARDGWPFGGLVAHDFNNVLTGVLLYCDLLMSVLGPSDRARKYAEEIRKAGMQATGLVRQLLTVFAPTNRRLDRFR